MVLIFNTSEPLQ